MAFFAVFGWDLVVFVVAILGGDTATIPSRPLDPGRGPHSGSDKKNRVIDSPHRHIFSWIEKPG